MINYMLWSWCLIFWTLQLFLPNIKLPHGFHTPQSSDYNEEQRMSEVCWNKHQRTTIWRRENSLRLSVSKNHQPIEIFHNIIRQRHRTSSLIWCDIILNLMEEFDLLCWLHLFQIHRKTEASWRRALK